MFDILPLSPVREWAISRSFIFTPPRTRTCGFASSRGSRTEATATDVARRFPRAAARGRTVGIERLDLVADADRLAQAFRPPGNAHAHFVGFAGARGNVRPVQGIDADQFEARFARGDIGQLQPLADNLQRQPSPRQCAGAGIGDLALADVAVDVADRDLQRVGSLRAAAAADPDAIGCRSPRPARAKNRRRRPAGDSVRDRALRRATVPCRCAPSPHRPIPRPW